MLHRLRLREKLVYLEGLLGTISKNHLDGVKALGVLINSSPKDSEPNSELSSREYDLLIRNIKSLGADLERVIADSHKVLHELPKLGEYYSKLESKHRLYNKIDRLGKDLGEFNKDGRESPSKEHFMSDFAESKTVTLEDIIIWSMITRDLNRVNATRLVEGIIPEGKTSKVYSSDDLGHYRCPLGPHTQVMLKEYIKVKRVRYLNVKLSKD